MECMDNTTAKPPIVDMHSNIVTQNITVSQQTPRFQICISNIEGATVQHPSMECILEKH